MDIVDGNGDGGCDGDLEDTAGEKLHAPQQHGTSRDCTNFYTDLDSTALQHPQRIQQVLASLQRHKHTDSIHHAVLEELLIHRRQRPRGYSSVFSNGVDYSASLPAATPTATSSTSLSQSWMGAVRAAERGRGKSVQTAGSQLLGSLIERTSCLQKRRIKIPGGTLWRYLKSKHTYRFQLQRFLALLHSHPLVRPTSPIPPPPRSSASGMEGAGEPGEGGEGKAERELEIWREEERIWRERGVALGGASGAVEEACWRVVKLEAKKMLRSQVALSHSKETCKRALRHAKETY